MNLGPFKKSGRNPLTLFWSGVALGHLKVDPQSKILGLSTVQCPCEGPTLVSGYNGNFCSPMMFIMVNRAACGLTRFQYHLSDFFSGTLLLSSGLRFRLNDHSLKHAYSLRPCSSSTARGAHICLGPVRLPGDLRIPRIPPWLRLCTIHMHRSALLGDAWDFGAWQNNQWQFSFTVKHHKVKEINLFANYHQYVVCWRDTHLFASDPLVVSYESLISYVIFQCYM